MRVLFGVVIVIAVTQARFLSSNGVDLEPIFEFLDDSGDGEINEIELKALTYLGDADGDGIVTSAEFDDAWEDFAVGLGLPMENRDKYFEISDGVDGSAADGVLTESENDALFDMFDKDGSGKLSKDEFFDSTALLLGE